MLGKDNDYEYTVTVNQGDSSVSGGQINGKSTRVNGSGEHFFERYNYKGSQGVRWKYSPTLKTDRALLWFNS
jgi:hypothetical protein